MTNFITLDNTRFHNAEKASSASVGNPKEQVSPQSVANFESAMQDKQADNSKQGYTGTQGEAPQESLASLFQSMSMPMDSLFSQMTQSTTATSAPTSEINQLTTTLAERILVSDPKGGEQEVRIMLNDSTLRGTEIRITRTPEGMLNLTLATDNASSFQTLVGAQDSLKQKLEQMEKSDVRVTVMDESQQNDNNENRRSAGFVDYTDQVAPHD